MVIYKTTNLINGKIYIGKDEKNKPNYYGSGLLITKAIKKYGKKNFIKEIIEFCSTKEELNIQEKYWIKKYNSTDILIGYNILPGGDGGLTSTKEHLSKKVKELWRNEEYVNKQKESRKNRTYRKKGEYTHSEETKSKIREAHINKKNTPEQIEKTRKHNLEKRIYSIIKCVETGIIFKSIQDAKRWLGKGDIQSCIDGRQKTAGGFHWIRLSEIKHRKN